MSIKDLNIKAILPVLAIILTLSLSAAAITMSWSVTHVNTRRAVAVEQVSLQNRQNRCLAAVEGRLFLIIYELSVSPESTPSQDLIRSTEELAEALRNLDDLCFTKEPSERPVSPAPELGP